MSESLDAGPIFHIDTVPIIPGETYGIHATKLSLAAPSCSEKLLDTLAELNDSQLTAQDASTARWFGRPTLADRTINWDQQTAGEIERLVNACNPDYRGALTYYRGVAVRLLEVNPADVHSSPIAP